MRCVRGSRVRACNVPDGLQLHSGTRRRRAVSRVRTQQVQGEWASREKGGSSTSSALLALAQEQQVDLLVLGSYGRKGARS